MCTHYKYYIQVYIYLNEVVKINVCEIYCASGIIHVHKTHSTNIHTCVRIYLYMRLAA